MSKFGVRVRGDAAIGYRTILCMPNLCLPILLNNGTTFTAHPNLLQPKFSQWHIMAPKSVHLYGISYRFWNIKATKLSTFRMCQLQKLKNAASTDFLVKFLGPGNLSDLNFKIIWPHCCGILRLCHTVTRGKSKVGLGLFSVTHP